MALEGFVTFLELCKEHMAAADTASVLVGFVFAHILMLTLLFYHLGDVDELRTFSQHSFLFPVNVDDGGNRKG